ncbi:MAG: twin-arginine translocase TatA/TatE family subunit, partial [Deltaproteobacteria bacterium]|nr:twin-arginine translocase TatA/TatE family subunit [Deltaproteobacteria bacterium]
MPRRSPLILIWLFPGEAPNTDPNTEEKSPHNEQLARPHFPICFRLRATHGPRREGLRQVDYSPFPRVSLDAGNNLGLLLNESDAGLCLVVAEKESVGSLLRVVVRGLHGRTSRDVVARVVWCSDAEQGRTRLGLELLRESRRTNPAGSRAIAREPAADAARPLSRRTALEVDSRLGPVSLDAGRETGGRKQTRSDWGPAIIRGGVVGSQIHEREGWQRQIRGGRRCWPSFLLLSQRRALDARRPTRPTHARNKARIAPMFGIGPIELAVVLVVALLVMGPKKLPELARTVGRGLAEFRRASNDLRRSMDLDLESHKIEPPP